MARAAKVKKINPKPEGLGEETFSLDAERASELNRRLDEARRGASDPLPASKVLMRLRRRR